LFGDIMRRLIEIGAVDVREGTQSSFMSEASGSVVDEMRRQAAAMGERSCINSVA
jgi:hypothetical protein